MNSDQLTEWLGCSRAKVYDLVKEGMPHYGLGIGKRARYRFSEEGVEKWLTQCCGGNAVPIEEIRPRRLPVDDIFGERGYIQ